VLDLPVDETTWQQTWNFKSVFQRRRGGTRGKPGTAV
jgi:hypothetical protein